MLFNLLLAADEPANDKQWVMWVIIAVVIVLMIVLTIVPQKKRQKEQQKMMNSLVVGTKLMTVGGLVGRITQVNNDNTLIINVGTENNPTLIVIDRKAVGYVLENVNAPAPAAEPTPVDSATEETSPVTKTETVTKETSSVTEAADETETEEDHDHIEDIHDYEDSALPKEESALSDLDKPF